ncbi:MAG: phytanoyl-CoA dioxygenase family protein [Sphingomonadaceae bacterium]|nr:phytanoyl-CoA dioxygenase family protein [Sphingomonadaceae bacterium]
MTVDIEAASGVTAEMVEAFRERGWAAAPGFFSADEIAEIARWTGEVTDLPERSGAQMLYREPSLLDADAKVVQRIEDFCPHHDGFDALMRGGPLQQAVERLIGEPALLFKDKINFKMPGGAGFEAHQDQQAGWSTYAPWFVTALVTIDPATIENGCLEMAGGPRVTSLIGAEWKPLTPGELSAAPLEPVPTAPGDVLFFDSYAPHASKPNLTAQQRRILYVTYNRAADGDQRGRYFADKRASFPPDIDRKPGDTYRFRV